MSAQPTLLLDPEWEHGWGRPEQSVRPRTDLALDIRSVPPFMPMWEFEACDGARVATQRPVNVSVQLEGPTDEFSGHAFVFACPALHVYASAASYAEAAQMFQDQVVYFYNHYTGIGAEDLDADAQAIQNLYRNHFFARIEA